MKLRDFMASSFPRVRGRRGKKCQPSGTTTGAAASLSAAAVAVAAVSATPSPKKHQPEPCAEGGVGASPATPKSGRHGHWFQFGESPFGFLERLVGKESPVKRLFEGKERHHAARASSSSSSSSGGQRVHPEARDEPEIRATKAASGLDSANPYSCVGLTSAADAEGGSCWCADPDPAVSISCPTHCRGDSDSSSLYAGCHGYAESVTSYGSSTPGSQRGVRSRSRIRTNPWLPSPRPSPYCVRSLSSPCASSSRSLSPSSSSPVPPSSSDNTSPLTSHPSDVISAFERQPQRHRHRHRRHHSEINAADLTRHFAFDSYLTDTEQYFSTLDSGIGETTTSPDEKDKHTTNAAHKKHRAFHAKRRSSERDPQCFSYPKGYHLPSASPSPKFRTKSRSKAKSKGVVANRDSQFWDSDSSRSPPRVPKAFASKASAWDSDHSGSPLRTRDSDSGSCDERDRGIGLNPARYRGPGNAECASAALSLACEDICLITSNIEQLAQNISFEYEESLNASFESAKSDPLIQRGDDDRCSSLRALLSIDAEDRVLVPDCADRVVSSEDGQNSEPASKYGEDIADNRESEACSLETANSELSAASSDTTPTTDVAVQTDFYDEDEEENSGSDWQASTESGSDWLVSNGSGSDWLASGGSGCDWLTGDRSGCATDEEEEEGEVGGKVGQEEADLSHWEEAGKVWRIPDIMQDSTDTGYSSLSRDGRIVNDSDNNNNNRNTANDSSDSAKGSEESSKKSTHNTNSRDSGIASGGVRSKTLTTHEKTVFDGFDIQGEFYPQRISYTFHFDGAKSDAKSEVLPRDDAALASSCAEDRSKVCTCGTDVSKEPDPRLEEPLYDEVYVSVAHLQNRRQEEQRRRHDDLVPYPYDVTRFLDVTSPRGEGMGFTDDPAPSRFDRASFRSSSASAGEKGQKSARRHYPPFDKAPVTGTGDDVCSCDVNASAAYDVPSDNPQRRYLTREASSSRPSQPTDISSHHSPMCPRATVYPASRPVPCGPQTARHALTPPRTSTPRALPDHAGPALSAQDLASLSRVSCSLQKEALSSLDPRHCQRRLADRAGRVEAGSAPARTFGPRSYNLDDTHRHPPAYLDDTHRHPPAYLDDTHRHPPAYLDDTHRHPPAYLDDDVPANMRGPVDRRGSGKGEGRDGSHAFHFHDDDDALPSSGRSLHEVATSLEHKVSALRHERHTADRKLREAHEAREAREEEAVRRQHKARFQRLLAMHRKSVLLQTLQDLRRRLESQSARLQASYSTVLNIRKRYA